jgi:hypothetical protein
MTLTTLDFAGKNIRFEMRGDRVWVSLTDMAKATGKKVNDYTRLSSTIDFLEEFVSVTGIPVTETNQGGIPEKQGTWAIEEVAIDFAAWCNVKFRVWVSQQIKTLMTEGTVSIAPQTEQPKLGSSVEATVAMISPLRALLSTIPAALVDGFLLNQVQKHHPELKADINAGHSLLAANTPIAEILLTPTAIGDRLGVSGRVINALLTHHGYQVKNPNKGKTEPAYLPTEKGKPYSSNTIATGRLEDNTSYQHTKWVESMVETVRDLM